MVASKYKTGITVSKVLFDINQYWTKVRLLCRDVELVRAHHAVDLVAGSAENLKELESDQSSSSSTSATNGAGNSKRTTSKTVSSTTPIVLLDIRVLFTRSASGVRRSTRRRGRNDDDGHMDEDGPAEPVKFYVWFTFTLEDLLSFPSPDSFTWRLEVVYGNIRYRP